MCKEKNNLNKKKEKKSTPDSHLTYNLGDKLDELFPEFKPSKKKEENK